MEANNELEFDKEKTLELRDAYKQARKEGITCMIFEGNEYLVEYTKYLLEYLCNKHDIKNY